MTKNFTEILRNIVRKWRALKHSRLIVPLSNVPSENPTIYFFTPDTNVPAGGVLVIYRHVDLLNSAGVPAFVLHQNKGFRCTWFLNNTKVTDVKSTKVRKGDLLVMPELDVSLLCQHTTSVNHVIFNQNSHLTWKRDTNKVIQHYLKSPDLKGVVVVSEHNQEMLRYAFHGLTVSRIHLSIDSALFYAGNAQRGRRISYMPRRGGEDAGKVFDLLRGRGVLDDWTLVPLDGLKHDEVARELRTTKIFMAFTYQEGFGLPAAEAMACGNYVVGYHGYGGREFFLPEFSAPVDMGDILSFARAVENAILNDNADDSWCLDRGRAASEYILQNYSTERESTEVVSAYKKFLNEINDPNFKTNILESSSN